MDTKPRPIPETTASSSAKPSAKAPAAEKSHRVTTTITREQYERLAQVAEQRGQSVAEVFRRSIECLLSEQTELARRKAELQALVAKGPPHDWQRLHDLMDFPPWIAERQAAVTRLLSLEAPVDDWEQMEAEIESGYLACETE